MYRDVDPLTDAPPDPCTPSEARQRVTALYQAHALGLVRLAKVMLGDQPARQREAVVLRHYLGLTEDQTAQAMNVSRGTVKSATSRGRAALARMLKENQ
jgi:DNA-directed RNA polymerase specialized sigma24 family protein